MHVCVYIYIYNPKSCILYISWLHSWAPAPRYEHYKPEQAELFVYIYIYIYICINNNNNVIIQYIPHL